MFTRLVTICDRQMDAREKHPDGVGGGGGGET